MCGGSSQFILDLVKVTEHERSKSCTRTSHQHWQPLGSRSSSISPAARTVMDPTSPAIAASYRTRRRLRGDSGDTSVMRPRLTATRFVGRIGELAELELALHDASEGRPAVVLL